MTSATRLVIVARDRTNFLRSMQADFATDSRIEVVVDRRVSPERRRHNGAFHILEKRRGDRRRRRFVDAQVRAVGFATVDL